MKDYDIYMGTRGAINKCNKEEMGDGTQYDDRSSGNFKSKLETEISYT